MHGRFEKRSQRRKTVGNCVAPDCAVPLLGDGTWRNLAPALRTGFARHGGKGLCSKHYNRLHQQGTIELVGRVRKVRVTQCAKCACEMVPQDTPAELRGGRRVHRARMLCAPCYKVEHRAGNLEAWAPKTTRIDSAELDSYLDDWEMMRDDGVGMREAAARLGLKVSTFDKILYRARKRGDPRGSTVAFAHDMRRAA